MDTSSESSVFSSSELNFEELMETTPNEFINAIDSRRPNWTDGLDKDFKAWIAHNRAKFDRNNTLDIGDHYINFSRKVS